MSAATKGRYYVTGRFSVEVRAMSMSITQAVGQ